jgi:tetratricopeptide (TPR) repeat protein
MFRVLFLLSLLLPVAALAEAPAAVAAAPLPEAGVRYGDRDPAAVAIIPRPGNRASFRRTLNAAIRKDPKDTVALMHRAYLLNAAGDTAEGDRDFQRVLEITAANGDSVNHRRALWSLGWSAYNRGQAGEAVAWWQQAAAGFRGHPSWVPYTLAVGLWTMGERDAALAWYGVAADSDAAWRQSEGVQARTQRWREAEQAAAQALFQAWSARATAAAP